MEPPHPLAQSATTPPVRPQGAPISRSLILLAAGLGTRFGGPKQLQPVGPNDEPIFAISAAQARSAGIERLILVTRAELEAPLREAAERFVPDMETVLVRQDLAGPPRDKPWGTAHAVGACANVVDGPFGVANGDDLYGDPSMQLLADGLSEDAHSGVLVGFPLAATLSHHGGVSRGICRVTDGWLDSVVETHGLVATPDGDVADGAGGRYAPDATASMNLWGLPASAAQRMADGFERFLADGPGPTDEYLLPTEVANMMAEGLTIRVVSSSGAWMGLTHREDLPEVRAALAAAPD
ncbi:MAG: NTP transferase domain-containing protein [Microthrixaceae bacterium]